MAASLRGERLADGAVKLARDYPKNIIWSEPLLGSVFGKDRRPFSEWLHSGDPLPQAAEEFRRFMSSTDMNCYQWIILAALRSAVIDRRTAIRYYDSFAHFAASNKTANVKALYGANQPLPINVEYTQNGREWNVKSVKGPGIDFAQKGDIITFSGRAHVMVVTGKDAQGHLLVASFPTVIYGDHAGHPGPADPYVGALEKFLQTNLDDWKNSFDGYSNYLKDDEILVGPPAFL
jgi:hypothetical protein